MRLRAAALLLAALLAPARASADECQRGWVADIDVPRKGSSAPPNARFRVLEYEGCSSVPGGPRHAFRLRSEQGAEISLRAEPWAEDFLELTPEAPLAEGLYTLEVRRPSAPDALGPWETMTTATVAGLPDTTAPELEGLLSGEAFAVEGHMALSPCNSVPGWELKTRLTFRAARDGGRPHDELLYRLERKAAGGSGGKDVPWKEVTTLRPTPDGDRMSFEWTSERGFGEAFTYRLGVRDIAGNGATGLSTVTVHNPPRPARELWDGRLSGARSEPPAPSVQPGGRCVCRASIGMEEGNSGEAAACIAALVLAAHRRRHRRDEAGQRRERALRDAGHPSARHAKNDGQVINVSSLLGRAPHVPFPCSRDIEVAEKASPFVQPRHP